MPKRNIPQQFSGDVSVDSCRTHANNRVPVSLETLFLGNRNEVRKLSGLIPRVIAPVGVIETLQDIERLSADVSPRLVVALDSFGEGIRLNLLQHIKTRLNSAAVICLVDSISQQQEIELRSVGLIFLGSRETFINHAWKIVERVSQSSVGFRPESCR